MNKRFPRYPDDADYQTNAPSYYEDLSRKQKLIQLLAEKIWEYDERLDERLEDLENVLQDYLSQWDERIENLDDEVSHIFITWLEDGTLEKIINHDVLGNKADKVHLEQLGTNVKTLGAVGDGIADDTMAIQNALDMGGEIIIPKGTYRITEGLKIRKDFTYVTGVGNPLIQFDGNVESAESVLMATTNTHENKKVFEGVEIKHLRINGGHKSKWLLNLRQFSFDCRVIDVHLAHSVGMILSRDCYYSQWENIYVWGVTNGCPDGFPIDDWVDVHNNEYIAPVTFLNAHSVNIKDFHMGRFGTSSNNIPNSHDQTTHAMLLTGYPNTLDTISFEVSNGEVDSVISLDYGSNTKISNVYLENVHANRLIIVRGNYFGNVDIENIMLEMNNSFNTAIIYSISKNINIKLHGLIGRGMIKTPNKLVQAGFGASVDLKNAQLTNGTVQEYNGKLYEESYVDYYGTIGTDSGEISNNIPYKVTGLNVTEDNNILYIDSGSYVNDFNETVRIGLSSISHSTPNNVIGKSFIINESGEWLLAVDRWGQMFIEKTTDRNPLGDLRLGTLILADFTTTVGGVISRINKRESGRSLRDGLFAGLDSTQNIPSNTATKIEFDRIDKGNNYFFKSDEPTRFYVGEGVKKVKLQCNLASRQSISGTVEVQILKNGSHFLGMSRIKEEINNDRFILNMSTGLIDVDYGDYFELLITHTNESNVDIGFTNTYIDRSSNWLQMNVYR